MRLHINSQFWLIYIFFAFSRKEKRRRRRKREKKTIQHQIETDPIRYDTIHSTHALTFMQTANVIEIIQSGAVS